LFNIIDITIRSVIDSIAAIVSSIAGVAGKYTEILSAGGGSSTGFLSGISSIAEGIAKLIPQLFDWIARFAITFTDVTKKFLVGLEYTMNSFRPFLKKGTPERLRDAQIGEIKAETKFARRE